jgi:hypothetical protein
MKLTIKIDTRKEEAQKFVEFIKSLSYVKIQEENELSEEDEAFFKLLKEEEKSGQGDKKRFEEILESL